MQSMRRGYTPGSEINRVDEAVHSSSGRIARVAIGGALMGMGIGRGGPMGGLMVLVGLEPLLAGMLNFSLFSTVSGLVTGGESAVESPYHEAGSGIEETAPTVY